MLKILNLKLENNIIIVELAKNNGMGRREGILGGRRAFIFKIFSNLIPNIICVT